MVFDDLGSLDPWDEGKLHAHQLSAYSSTPVLEHRLQRARACRRGWLCWILLRRRSFLDGFINGLEGELNRRAHDAAPH